MIGIFLLLLTLIMFCANLFMSAGILWWIVFLPAAIVIMASILTR
jgi:hypothetical protein